MKRAAYILVAVWALIFGSPIAQGEGPIDETRITLRDELLRIINRDRVQFGLKPVVLDPHASEVADNYCRQQIRNRTTGHFTIDGLSPYMRYSFAGGGDGVSENAAAWSANYNFNDRALYDMIRSSQRAMMREVPPHDGHRRTILDPYATHVGIGLAWEKGEFRLTQEFIRRYVEWNRAMPRNAYVGQRVMAIGKPVEGYRVEAISVHREPLPQPISPQTASALGSYRLPNERRDYLPRLRNYTERRGDAVYEIREEYTDGRKGDFTLTPDGAFSFAVPLLDGPGVYTVVVWVRGGGSDPIPATNVSIRVEGSAPEMAYSVGAGTR